jgi:gliding motility-associated-like protein
MLRKLFTLITLGILTGGTVQASHISGGEIYWDCIGPNEYTITLILYRDCAGIPVGNTETVTINSPCGSQTVTVTSPGGTEISQLCDAELPNSTCNGGTLPGIEEYVFTGTVTLTPCDSWTMSWTQCCRNSAVANLTNPDVQDTYIEATLNNLIAPCDDSPEFTNEPIPYVCLGYPITFSYGVFDPDADSLSYELISAMQGGGAPLGYDFPYSFIDPITGLTLDPLTGLVQFTLNQAGNWVVVVQVTSYDEDGNIIGTVMRDMQFVGVPCSNEPPDPTTGTIANLTGTAVQTGPYGLEMCESDQFCFTAVISDNNATDTLEALTNILQNLPGATFSYTGINPITVNICWTATPGTSGFFPFIITVNDGACPIEGFQTYVYSVNVLQRTSAGPDITICGPQVAEIEAEGGSIFTWSVLSGEAITATNFLCVTPSCATVIADPSITTTYIVTSDLSGSCVNADTVTVFVVPDFSFSVTTSDPNLCLGETVQFTTIVNPNVPGYIYEWTPGTGLSSTTIGNPVGSYQFPGTYEYLVEVTSPDGCVKLDTTVVVEVAPSFVPDFTVSQLDELVCQGESSQFFVQLNNAPPEFCGANPSVCSTGVVAQAEIGTEINAGTGFSYPSVFGNFYQGAKHQILFRADELVNQGFAGGTFNQLAMDIAAINGASSYYGFTIKMGCTTLNELTLGNYIDGLTTVFYADTLNIATGWNNFLLNPGFDWPGGVNVVIETCFDHFGLGIPFTQNSPTYYSVTPFNSVIHRNSDGGGVCGTPVGFMAESATGQRPNMRFTVCAGVNEDLLSYSWSPSIGLSDPNAPNPIVTPQASPVTYTVSVGDTALGCFGTADLTIGWYPGADVSVVPSPSVGVFPLTVNFDNTSASDVINYNWSFSDPMIPGTTDVEPTVTFNTPGWYYITLSGTDIGGCFGSFVDSVLVLSQPIVEVPNVFSPNGDGDNDLFEYVDLQGFNYASMKIYNRWGNLVKETNTNGNNKLIWSPSGNVTDGTYFWIFKGDASNGESVDKVGTVTLLR